jgi:cobalt-zinc-cadmium efflux system membrane fusion protein
MSNRKIFVNAMIIFAGILMVFLIARIDRTSEDGDSHEGHSPEHEEEMVRGSHGGRLLTEDNFQLEITIYERGVPPQFRIYSFKKGKEIDPSEVQLTIELHRLGGRIDVIGFSKEEKYLLGDKVVEEPHSFDVKVIAEFEGRTHRWEFSSYEGRTELSPESVKSAGIVIEEAGPVEMESILELPGEIVLNKDKVVHILPRFTGIVTEVMKNLGDAVKKDEMIAVIESRELADAKREYIKSTHHVEFSKASFKREKELWEKKISPEEDYLKKRHTYEEAKISYEASRQKLKVLGLSDENIQTLSKHHEENLARYELRVPFDGVVIEKHVAIGQAVKAEDELFRLADLASVWVDVHVYAKNLKAVKADQEVRVRSEDLDEEASSHIAYAGPLVGDKTRSAKARIVLDNPNGKWRPGLFVTVHLVEEKFEVPVAVKLEAIQTFRDWNVVFIQVGNIFEIRPLELGRRSGEWVEVLSGLSKGEKYVTKNSFVLKADVLKSGATHDH